MHKLNNIHTLIEFWILEFKLGDYSWDSDTPETYNVRGGVVQLLPLEVTGFTCWADTSKSTVIRRDSCICLRSSEIRSRLVGAVLWFVQLSHVHNRDVKDTKEEMVRRR